VGRFSGAFQGYCKNVALVALAQINRGVESKGNKRPGVSGLKPTPKFLYTFGQISYSDMSTEFTIGATVCLASQPPYIKTADPMPMLRPAQLIAVGATGTVIARQPGDYWVVKFDRGSFLIDGKYLSETATSPDLTTPESQN
jgi:Protein of unknown function (DUF3148)